ncbi:DoxX family protein [Segetibacter koreensis]|uniref:DoxX family protein n=1 Tax=Segetibacter koreensis TaxID=398037 RepID=UPI00037B4A7D|nr:DoxX family protein [Segetibacter koreensis]
MKRTLSTNINSNAVNFWLFVARVAIGLFMLTHGIPKLQSLMSGHVKFADPFGIGATPSLILSVFAEFICSVLLILGLAVRLAAIPLIINMFTAIFIAHGGQPFAKKELALMYLLIYLGLLLIGAGKFSIDHLIAGGKGRRR